MMNTRTGLIVVVVLAGVAVLSWTLLRPKPPEGPPVLPKGIPVYVSPALTKPFEGLQAAMGVAYPGTILRPIPLDATAMQDLASGKGQGMILAPSQDLAALQQAGKLATDSQVVLEPATQVVIVRTSMLPVGPAMETFNQFINTPAARQPFQ